MAIDTDGASGLARTLTYKQGIPIALGSVIGSGVLFLPSFTYKAAGSSAIWSWLAATALCFPLLVIFVDMVSEVGDERGVQGFVALGLGRRAAASVPFLLLGTVSFGMPAAALIVGEYFALLFDHSSIRFPAALAIVIASVLTNLWGTGNASRVQLVISLATFGVGFSLVCLTFPEASASYHKFASMPALVPTLSGGLVAFWAYAGFENLTFVAGEFRHPRKDFAVSLIVALLLSGALYIGLVLNYASLISPDRINTLAGLYQLSELVPPTALTTTLIALFALAAVQLNFNSWIWGISRLVMASARQGLLPRFLAHTNEKSIPTRAISLLGCIFSLVLGVTLFWPEYIDNVIVAVSTNFVFIYALCAISYWRFARGKRRRWLGVAVLVVVVPAMAMSGWLILYPLALVLMSLVATRRPAVEQ